LNKNSNSKKLVPKTLEVQFEELKARGSALAYGLSVATVGFCYLDTDLRYIYINEWLAEINGFTVEEHIGRSVRELFPDLAVGIEPQFQKVIETGNPIIKGRVYAETPFRPGVKRLFEHNYFADKSADGIVQGISCFVEDITDRDTAEQKLKANEIRYDLAVRATTDGIWDWNMITNREYFSPRWCEIIGYTSDDPDLPHSYDSWASRIHPDYYDSVMEALLPRSKFPHY